MTPPAAGRAALSILIAAAALPGLALGRPGTTSADTLTASSVAITSAAGTDNQYHAGDTITPTVTFSTAVAGHSSASLAIDVDGVDRSATPDSTAAGATTLSFNYVVTDADRILTALPWPATPWPELTPAPATRARPTRIPPLPPP